MIDILLLIEELITKIKHTEPYQERKKVIRIGFITGQAVMAIIKVDNTN